MHVIDLKAGKISATQNWGGFLIGICPDGKTCLIGGGDQMLQTIGYGPTGLTRLQSTARLSDAGQGIFASPDGKYVCWPSGGGNAGLGMTYATAVFKADDLKKPAFVMHSGAFPRVVGFDVKAELAYTMNSGKQLMTFTFDGKKQKEYQLPGGGETRAIAPHPEGRRVLVLTEKGLCDVKLPPG
jgi:hypothetical protein